MRCSSCELLLDRYVEGTLPPARMIAVRRHLERCPSCESLVTELRVIDALLATTSVPDLPANFTFAVMAESRSIVAPKRFARRRAAFLVAAYVVAAWLAVVAGYGQLAGVFSAIASPDGSVARTFAPVAHALHAITPVSPAFAAAGFGALTVDLVLLAVAIAFYRAVRPRLAMARATAEDRT